MTIPAAENDRPDTEFQRSDIAELNLVPETTL